MRTSAAIVNVIEISDERLLSTSKSVLISLVNIEEV